MEFGFGLKERYNYVILCVYPYCPRFTDKKTDSALSFFARVIVRSDQ